jgi:hypothetical protein
LLEEVGVVFLVVAEQAAIEHLLEHRVVGLLLNHN